MPSGPIVLVFDNLRYGTIAMHQAHADRPIRTSELGPIDFAAYARSVGAVGIDVDSDAAFEPALRERVPAIDYIDLRFDEARGRDRRIYVRPAGAARTSLVALPSAQVLASSNSDRGRSRRRR